MQAGWTRTAVMALALMSSGTANALPWFVEDADGATELTQALDELWPEHPVEVRVGDASGDGFYVHDQALVLVVNGQEHSRSTGGSTAAAVAMARSWLRELESTGGWVPTPENLIVSESSESAEPPSEVNPPVAHLGVGVHQSMLRDGWINGVRVLGGLTQGPWVGELSLYITTGGSTEYSKMDRVLNALAPDENRRSFADTYAVTGTAQRRFWAGPQPERLAGGPFLAAGVGLRRYVVRDIDNQDGQDTIVLLPNSERSDFGPDLGLGMEVWIGTRTGLKFGVIDRVRFQRASDETPIVTTHEGVLSLDLVYSP